MAMSNDKSEGNVNTEIMWQLWWGRVIRDEWNHINTLPPPGSLGVSKLGKTIHI